MYAPIGIEYGLVEGCFKERSFGKTFEYVLADENEFGLPHKVFVGPLGDWRYAEVKKTVANILIDEDLIEKWEIRTSWRRA